MTLFICASVYQLFNAINITAQEKEKADIVLVKSGNNFVNSIYPEKLSAYFDHVYIFELVVPQSRLKKLLDVTRKLWFPGGILAQLKRKYQKVFLSGTEIYSKIIAENSRSKEGVFFYYEDGLASYYSVLNEETKKKNDFLLLLRYGHRNLDLCRGMYVYEPECVVNNSKSIPCISIRKIKREKDSALGGIFRDTPFSITTRFVFLNAWFEDEREYELQTKLCQALIDKVGSDNVSIKSHPNELNKKEKLKGVKYIDSRCSFEVSNCYESWDNVVFVSAISTASISPKMVYGDTPKTIYLYRFFQREFGEWENIDELVSLIRSLYSNERDLLIPDNMDEYLRELNDLMPVSDFDKR